MYQWYILMGKCGSQSHGTRGTSWLSDSVRDLQERDRGFNRQLGWSSCWRCALGQSLYPHVHPLDSGVKVGTLQDRQGLCVWLVMCAKPCGCQAVCSSGSWDGLWMNRVLWPGGNCVKSGEQRLCWDTSTFTCTWPDLNPASSSPIKHGFPIK